MVAATPGPSAKPCVTYIAGLGHSGTTTLARHLSLGSNTHFLGEVSPSLELTAAERGQARFMCSCGKLAADCAFWSAVLPSVDREGDARVGHVELLAAAASRWGSGASLIDSSKSLENLERGWLPLWRAGRIDLKCILIVRDFRSWARSRERVDRKKGRTGKPYLVRCWKWLSANQRLEAELAALGMPLARVSFEQFLIGADAQVTRLVAELQLPGGREAGESHDMHGNRSRLKPIGNPLDHLDLAWTVDRRSLLYGPALLRCNAYQERFRARCVPATVT